MEEKRAAAEIAVPSNDSPRGRRAQRAATGAIISPALEAHALIEAVAAAVGNQIIVQQETLVTHLVDHQFLIQDLIATTQQAAIQQAADAARIATLTEENERLKQENELLRREVIERDARADQLERSLHELNARLEITSRDAVAIQQQLERGQTELETRLTAQHQDFLAQLERTQDQYTARLTALESRGLFRRRKRPLG